MKYSKYPDSTEKVIKAADLLEELIPHLKEIVNEIRSGEPAYARLYEARARLGRIISHGGFPTGVPKASGHDWSDL